MLLKFLFFSVLGACNPFIVRVQHSLNGHEAPIYRSWRYRNVVPRRAAIRLFTQTARQALMGLYKLFLELLNNLARR